MKRNISYGNSFLLLLLSLFFGTSVEAQSYLPRSYFAVWDIDKNDKLTHAEFYEGLSISRLFEIWDQNQDGHLVRQEFYNNFEKVFPDFSASLPEGPVSQISSFAGYFPELENSASPDLEMVNDAMFRLADLNRNGKLNKAEFYTLIFRTLDTNENGFLYQAECKQGTLARWFMR